jgi:hypothetical protein
MGKKSGSRTGIQIHDEQLRSYFGVKIIKFFDSDPGSGWKEFGSWIRDRKNSDPGSGIIITSWIQRHYCRTMDRYFDSNDPFLNIIGRGSDINKNLT